MLTLVSLSCQTRTEGSSWELKSCLGVCIQHTPVHTYTSVINSSTHIHPWVLVPLKGFDVICGAFVFVCCFCICVSAYHTQCLKLESVSGNSWITKFVAVRAAGSCHTSSTVLLSLSVCVCVYAEEAHPALRNYQRDMPFGVPSSIWYMFWHHALKGPCSHIRLNQSFE